MSKLKKTAYEPLLKEALSCWRCDKAVKNMPAMKVHLQEEWEKERDGERAKAAKNRSSSEQAAE
jgi:aprataxin